MPTCSSRARSSSLRHQEPGPGLALGVDDGVERVEPLLGLVGIDVGQLVDEPVDRSWVQRASIGPVRTQLRLGHDAAIGAGYRMTARTAEVPRCVETVSVECRRRRSCTPTAPAAGTRARAAGRGPCPTAPFASGAEAHTTNQRMEITAALEAVQAHRRPARGRERLDLRRELLPRPVVGGLAASGAGRNSQTKPVANRDLWEPFIDLVLERGRRRVPLGQGPRRRPDERPGRPAGGRGGRDPAGRTRRRAARRRRRSAAPTSSPARSPAAAPRRRRSAARPTGHRLVVVRAPAAGARRLRRQPGRRRRAAPAGRDPRGQGASCTPTWSCSPGSARRRAARRRGGDRRRRAVRGGAAVSRPGLGRGRRRRRSTSPSCVDAAADVVAAAERRCRRPQQKAGAALARRDAWLARDADEAVLVWDGDDAVARPARTGRSQDHLGDDVWVLEPASRRRRRQPVVRVGVDTGGTFTDVVADDGAIAKVPSTPADPGEAVRVGRRATARRRRPARRAGPRHDGGHQRAARAAGRAGRAGHERGLRRRDRDRPPGPAVALRPVGRPARRRWSPRDRRFEVRGRLDADGRRARAVRPATRAGRCPTTSRRSRCACCTPTSTRRTSGRSPPRCARRGYDVTCSHEVSPEFREYERTVTTVVNAYLRPVCRAYLQRLADAGRRGAGDDVGRRARAGRPTRPSCRRRCCCRARPAACGPRPRSPRPTATPTRSRFDMGGTSTDVCLVLGGVPEPAGRAVGRRASRSGCRRSTSTRSAPAAGRSPGIDAGGALRGRARERRRRARARPATAGAATEPTVTDADLVVGRIPADAALPGLGRLDVDAAARGARRRRRRPPRA